MSRVVHIASHVGTYGGERFVGALVRAQCAKGANATVITLYDSPGIPGVATYSAGRRAAYAPGGGFSFFFRLVRMLRTLKPDIAHTHLAHAKYWGRLAALMAGVPRIVHTEHSSDFSASPLRRTLTRMLHARTDRVVALTHAQAERIVHCEGARPNRVAVIPNGIEFHLAPIDRLAARRALGVQSGSLAIVFVGRLDAVKVPLRAVDALALLPAELNAHLYFVGDGSLRSAVAERARLRGVAERTHLLGYRQDIAAVLAAADAALNTSDSESMPLSLIEAICAGVPVVATPWPGAQELVGEAGRVAGSFEGSAIAAELESVLHLETRAAPEAMQALRERFSITRAASEYLALYEGLLELDRAPNASAIPGIPELSGLPQ